MQGLGFRIIPGSRSPQGNVGLWGLIPYTAKSWGPSGLRQVHAGLEFRA